MPKFYNQTEAHYRIHREELKQTLSFTSRLRNCNGTGKEGFTCSVERRWVFLATPEDGRGLVLVRASGKFASDQAPVFWSLPNIEIAKLGPVQCTLFKWDEQHFEYTESQGAQDPCKRRAN